jgi:hypothetical protein
MLKRRQRPKAWYLDDLRNDGLLAGGEEKRVLAGDELGVHEVLPVRRVAERALQLRAGCAGQAGLARRGNAAGVRGAEVVADLVRHGIDGLPVADKVCVYCVCVCV